ncbi:LuxR C-terminal-related transcriptional regulator [Streptomyces sp. NPDC059894]|uniref:helix-turn-helix transcriptional regulator n=1 Tax=unclassified Streptomyces TaxID=2593676 RepID=UPI0036660694
MLGQLGIDPVTESVYRYLLVNPSGDISDWATATGLLESEVRQALDRLSELSLVNLCADSFQVRTVNPLPGLEALLARQQAELAEQQHNIEATKAAVAELVASYAHKQSVSGGGMQYLKGIEAVRDYIADSCESAQCELLSFAPGGPQTFENMRASRPLNRSLLDRGVKMRTIYLDSIRRDPPTVAHAEWLVSLGAHVRTVPSLPNRILIWDRASALIAADCEDTSAGAIVVTNTGLIRLLCALFDHVWQSADPLGAPMRRGGGEFSKQQTEVIRQMALGRTDEAIAKSIGVSTRTVRRLVTSVLNALDARSRFQAGVLSVQRGHLPSHPE